MRPLLAVLVACLFSCATVGGSVHYLLDASSVRYDLPETLVPAVKRALIPLPATRGDGQADQFTTADGGPEPGLYELSGEVQAASNAALETLLAEIRTKLGTAVTLGFEEGSSSWERAVDAGGALRGAVSAAPVQHFSNVARLTVRVALGEGGASVTGTTSAASTITLPDGTTPTGGTGASEPRTPWLEMSEVLPTCTPRLIQQVVMAETSGSTVTISMPSQAQRGDYLQVWFIGRALNLLPDPSSNWSFPTNSTNDGDDVAVTHLGVWPSDPGPWDFTQGGTTGPVVAVVQVIRYGDLPQFGQTVSPAGSSGPFELTDPVWSPVARTSIFGVAAGRGVTWDDPQPGTWDFETHGSLSTGLNFVLLALEDQSSFAALPLGSAGTSAGKVTAFQVSLTPACTPY